MKYLGKCVDRQGAIADLYTTGLKYYRTNPGHKREDKKRFKALWKNGKYIGKVNTWLVNYMVRKRWPVPMKAIPKGEEMRSWLASMAYSLRSSRPLEPAAAMHRREQ